MCMPQKPPSNWTAYVTCDAKIWFNRFYFSFCTVALFADIAFFHANRNSSAKIWKKTVKRQNSDKILWIICGVLKQSAQQQKVRYWCENAFDVPFRFAMKSTNFKCLTTAISVDWWSERGKKGRTHYVGNRNTKSSTAKTTFDRWKQLITAPMKNELPQRKTITKRTLRVDDNNDASIHQYASKQHEWIEKKTIAVILLFGRQETRHTHSLQDHCATDNTKDFAGSYSVSFFHQA